MRGEPGSKILLTIVRENEDRPLKISITRAVIKVNSVKSRMLEPGFGYVRISQFQSNTGENLINAVSELKKEHHAHLKGLVLDLRNNPGGVLTAAVQISDLFLNSGLVVYTQGRAEESRTNYAATQGDLLGWRAHGSAGEWRLGFSVRNRCRCIAGSAARHHCRSAHASANVPYKRFCRCTITAR